MITYLKNQNLDLRIRATENLFFFYERTNRLNEDLDFLLLQAKTLNLIRDIKNRFSQTEDGCYQLTLEETQNVAKLYIYQDFKDELDNIIERAFFAVYRNIAYVEMFIEQNDLERALFSLCEGYQIFGTALTPNNKYVFNAMDSIVISNKNREIAKIKAKRDVEINRPMYELIEKAWTDEWHQQPATKFANYIMHQPNKRELVGSATHEHIVKHVRKLKNERKIENLQN